MKSTMKKSLLAALCLLPLGLPAHAASARLDHLTTVIGDFQQGFIYWDKCSNLTREKSKHPNFVANADAAFGAYGREVQAEYPEASTRELAQAILKKTNTMKEKFLAQYSDPSFCTSPAADTIIKHMIILDGQSPQEMEHLLKTIGS